MRECTSGVVALRCPARASDGAADFLVSVPEKQGSPTSESGALVLTGLLLIVALVVTSSTSSGASAQSARGSRAPRASRLPIFTLGCGYTLLRVNCIFFPHAFVVGPCDPLGDSKTVQPGYYFLHRGHTPVDNLGVRTPLALCGSTSLISCHRRNRLSPPCVCLSWRCRTGNEAIGQPEPARRMLSGLFRPFSKGTTFDQEDDDVEQVPKHHAPPAVPHNEYSHHRHATADFTEADDDDEDSNDGRQQGYYNGAAPDEDGLAQSVGVLPLFAASHLGTTSNWRTASFIQDGMSY